MRSISHFIDGVVTGDTGGRRQDVFDPNVGRPQAQVSLGDAAVVDRAVATSTSTGPTASASTPAPRP